jgi:predicted Rossmann-fold nucleotide-binding protein
MFPRRVAIIGSRDYPELDAVREFVRTLPRGTIVVSGGARGVDAAAEREAKTLGLNVEVHYPRWDLFGRGAGLMRNRDIIRAADYVVAFTTGSRGTAHGIKLAQDAGTPLQVVTPGRRAKPLDEDAVRAVVAACLTRRPR